MSKSLHIVIIGTGNVAEHIAQSFLANNHIKLVQFFNHRKTTQATALAKKNNAEFISDYKKINKDCDVYIICVKDDAIHDVANQLKTLKLKGMVVHTSGSTDISVLKNTSPQIGVYYPLETFYKSAKINWKKTPILIEANTKEAKSTIKQLANSVSKKVENINSKNRLQIHLAAVFACNFTNAMYITAFGLLEKSMNKKQVSLLMPIMESSFNKLHHVHPKEAQTGPALRNDKTIMGRHLKLLKGDKELSDLYKSISNLIIKQKSS